MIDSWPVVHLSEVTSKVGSGATPRGGAASYSEAGTPLIRSMNVVFFGFKKDGLAYINDSQAAALNGVEVKTGDVLLNITGASIGRVTVAPSEMNGARVNQHVCIIRPTEVLDSRYLSAFLSSPGMQEQIGAEHYGVTRQALTKEQILNFEIPLPPLNQQKWIADKIHAHFLPRVRLCMDRIAHAAKILQRFRQSVLAAACRGRLTEDWRAAHSDLESASGVVQTLKKKKQNQTARWLEVFEPDTSDLSDLPDSWCWTNAGLLYDDAAYGTSVKCTTVRGNNTPVLRVPNIAAGRLDLKNLKYAKFSNSELRTLTPGEGDVLICRTNGSLDLVGKAAVMPRLNSLYAFASYLIRIRPNKACLLPGYLHLFLSAPVGRGQIEDKARTTAGQFNLNLGILGGLALPFPPLEEQHEIVRRVEALFKLADAIEKRVAAAQARADKLTQSILAKAFRGELVPTEAELARQEGREYEPASVLLERLHTAKADEQLIVKRTSKKITRHKQ